MQPAYRLYNVSALNAVELGPGSGDIRGLGSDGPRDLATALKA